MNQSIIKGAVSQIKRRLIVTQSSFDGVNEIIRRISSLINSIDLEIIASDITKTTSDVAEMLNSVTANSEPAISCLVSGNDGVNMFQPVEWPKISSC